MDKKFIKEIKQRYNFVKKIHKKIIKKRTEYWKIVFNYEKN